MRTDPRELLRTVAAGELAHLLWSDQQRDLIDRLLSAMTVVEGYAEHVMDAVGERLTPATRICAARSIATASAAALSTPWFSRLLGLELKMAQYRRQGLRDAVAAEAGVKGLERGLGARSRTCRAAPSPRRQSSGRATPGKRPGRLLALFR